MRHILFLLILVSFVVSCNESKESKGLFNIEADSGLKPFPLSKEAGSGELFMHIDSMVYQKFRLEEFSETDAATLTYFLEQKHLAEESKRSILYYYRRLPPWLLTDDPYGGGDFDNKVVSSSFYDNRLLYKSLNFGYILAQTNYETATLSRNQKLQIVLYRTSTGDNYILANNLTKRYHFALQLNEGTRTWHEGYSYRNQVDRLETYSLKEKLFPQLDIYEYYLQLPEKGTTILAVKDSAQTLADPEAFWRDKIANHSNKIIYLDWNAQKGVFQIRPTTSGNKKE